MVHVKKFFKIQRNIIVLLLVSLAMSIGLNVYLFLGVIKPLQEGRVGEEIHGWIRGRCGSQMWDMFSVKLTPNRVVLSYSSDRQFNVSVKGEYWAPFEFGSRTFYFKIYDKHVKSIWDGVIPADEPSKLVGEKTVIANKSRDEMYYIPVFNFTVTLDVGGIHVYSIVGATWSGVSLTSWDCIATFAVNVM